MAPSETATFLFTDIEGSTQLWEERADGIARSLARHDELLRSTVEAAGGTVVKTTGDGVHAAFDSPEDALVAAAAAQRALANEPWGETGALAVRMGIHTGGAQARDGDYYGTSVNRAARLMSIAHGGQVLVSQATEVLTRDALPAGVELHDLGDHRLRDLSRAERVYQLVAPGLRAEFPPPRSLDTRTSNLPVQLTTFVGRADERAAIAALIPDHRLVTIIGVGGIGKTRLALEVAAEWVGPLRDGAWCCELAPATDAESMIDIVASTLGVIGRLGATRRESVLDFLATKHMLLVLDNCEHLLDPVADFATDVLRRADDVRVLATSREPLSIPGEQVWGLRSLSLPADDDLDALAAADAVRLFVDRARANQPTFIVDAKNATAVAEVCRRLDGMPLAIELAAARVLTMQPAEIAGRLDERFRLLSAGRRTAVERHQTLRATVDWSYSLLTDDERAAYARLSVFPSSFDGDAATAVVGSDGLEPWQILDALDSLVAKSMLTNEDAGDGTTRFRMLETLRQYGRDRLGELGTDEIDERQRRHAAHYAELAAECGPRLGTSEEFPARRRIALEIDNLRSAIAWSLEQTSDADHALAIGIAGPLTLIVATNRSLGFGAFIERCAHVALSAPPRFRFTILGGAALSALQRGDAELARELLDAVFADPVPEDAGNYGTTYTALALLTVATDIDETMRVLREGAETAERMGDEYAAAVNRSTLGVFAAIAGDPETALTASEEGLARARRLGNPTAIAIGTFVWAAARWLDDPDGARAALEESRALTESGASDVVAGDVQELLARLQADAGELPSAILTLRAAVRGTVAVGNRLSLAGHLWYVSETLGQAGIELELVTVLEGVVLRNPALDLAVIGGRERTIHDRAIENAREGLGADRFEALLERGERMSYEEIVDYALTELDRVIEGFEADQELEHTQERG